MFGNFARIASLCMGFHPGTLHGCFFNSDFWPNLNFPLEHQIKLVLICVAKLCNHSNRHHLHNSVIKQWVNPKFFSAISFVR